MAVATSYGFAIIGAVIILVGGWAAAAFVHRAILRVARTIADLEKGQGVKRVHVAEALSYRRIMPGRGLAAD
ncbi:MAG: hypothetical protein EXQ84_07215 [Rhodospirillaceae bacterium]|nr:hypothetical protein [Rhodospirillaceae bacterium]